MAAFWRIVGVAAMFAVLMGGCPVQVVTDLDSTSGSLPIGGGSGTSGSSSSGGSSGSSTLGTQPPVDLLAAAFPGCSVTPSEHLWREEIMRLVNVERSRAGLDPLVQNEAMEDQATQYACEMIHYDFFAHDNPVTGSHVRDRAEEFGIILGENYVAIGENLAAGQSTPSQVMKDWMESEGHRANILSKDFTEIGIGIRTGGDYGTYWVQEFGRPIGN
jgi:uncharacterized protein YkwD